MAHHRGIRGRVATTTGAVTVALLASVVVSPLASAETRTGTPGDEFIKGSGKADILRGLGGNDILDGEGGEDDVRGGPGRDRLLSGKGDDRLNGGEGADELFGGANSDRYVFSGAFGKDLVEESSGNKDVLEFPDVPFEAASARRTGTKLVITTPRGSVTITDFFEECGERVEGFRFAGQFATWGGGSWDKKDALVRTDKIDKTNCKRTIPGTDKPIEIPPIKIPF